MHTHDANWPWLCVNAAERRKQILLQWCCWRNVSLKHRDSYSVPFQSRFICDLTAFVTTYSRLYRPSKFASALIRARAVCWTHSLTNVQAACLESVRNLKWQPKHMRFVNTKKKYSISLQKTLKSTVLSLFILLLPLIALVVLWACISLATSRQTKHCNVQHLSRTS